MVLVGDHHGHLVHELDPLEEVGALLGVRFTTSHSSLVSGLACEDVLGDAHLAHVVEERRQSERAQRLRLQPERSAEGKRQDAHVDGVVERVLVVTLDSGQADNGGGVLQEVVEERPTIRWRGPTSNARPSLASDSTSRIEVTPAS